MVVVGTKRIERFNVGQALDTVFCSRGILFRSGLKHKPIKIIHRVRPILSFAMSSSNEEQLKYLSEAQRKVKEQAFYMKRAIVSSRGCSQHTERPDEVLGRSGLRRMKFHTS